MGFERFAKCAGDFLTRMWTTRNGEVGAAQTRVNTLEHTQPRCYSERMAEILDRLQAQPAEQSAGFDPEGRQQTSTSITYLLAHWLTTQFRTLQSCRTAEHNCRDSPKSCVRVARPPRRAAEAISSPACRGSSACASACIMRAAEAQPSLRWTLPTQRGSVSASRPLPFLLPRRHCIS